MSLNRIALRTAIVTALNNFGAVPYPTLAGFRIYDSKIEPVENVEVDAAYPMCVIYTDYDRNAAAHASSLTAGRTLTITFELLIGILSKDSDSADFRLNLPVTDSELEASLDVFEHQIYEALRADTVPANVFRTIAYGVEQVVSRRGATTEGGTKIAARQITYEAKCLPEPASPTAPPYMTEFLDMLENSDGFSGIGKELKSIYAASGAVDGLDRIRKTMGWSNDTYSKLGYPSTPQVLLGSPVVWLNQNNQPL